MTRLLLRLFGIKDFEVCQSCETLKQQLAFERAEKKQLTDTLLNILSPKVAEALPVEISPVGVSSALFSRRRAAAEARDRHEAMLQKTSTLLGRPDDQAKQIEALEKELDVEEKAE
jgi:hypothetical protein